MQILDAIWVAGHLAWIKDHYDPQLYKCKHTPCWDTLVLTYLEVDLGNPLMRNPQLIRYLSLGLLPATASIFLQGRTEHLISDIMEIS